MRVKRHFWLEASETWEISDGADRTSNKFCQGMDWMSADLPQPCGFCSERIALTLPFLLLSRSRSKADTQPSRQSRGKVLWILIKLGKTSGGRGGAVGLSEELPVATLTQRPRG